MELTSIIARVDQHYDRCYERSLATASMMFRLHQATPDIITLVRLTKEGARFRCETIVDEFYLLAKKRASVTNGLYLPLNQQAYKIDTASACAAWDKIRQHIRQEERAHPTVSIHNVSDTFGRLRQVIDGHHFLLLDPRFNTYHTSDKKQGGRSIRYDHPLL